MEISIFEPYFFLLLIVSFSRNFSRKNQHAKNVALSNKIFYFHNTTIFSIYVLYHFMSFHFVFIMYYYYNHLLNNFEEKQTMYLLSFKQIIIISQYTLNVYSLQEQHFPFGLSFSRQFPASKGDVPWKPHNSRCHTHKSVISNLVQWPAAALGSNVTPHITSYGILITRVQSAPVRFACLDSYELFHALVLISLIKEGEDT